MTSYKINCTDLLQEQYNKCNQLITSRRLLSILARKELPPSRYFETTDQYWNEVENYINK